MVSYLGTIGTQIPYSDMAILGDASKILPIFRQGNRPYMHILQVGCRVWISMEKPYSSVAVAHT